MYSSALRVPGFFKHDRNLRLFKHLNKTSDNNQARLLLSLKQRMKGYEQKKNLNIMAFKFQLTMDNWISKSKNSRECSAAYQ